MSERDVPQPPQRRDRLIHERIHDPYKARLKLVDPSVCPQCGAVYESDRWRWGAPPVDAGEQLCQACHRINDQYPAGEVNTLPAIRSNSRMPSIRCTGSCRSTIGRTTSS